jgi:PAS domain S-box-containing protein
MEAIVNDRYKHFFFNNTDLACFASVDGYFEELNANFTRVLGYTTEDLVGKQFIDFIHSDDIESTMNEVSNLSEGIDTIKFVNRYRTKSNSFRYLEWNSTFNRTTNKIYGIARDVTESILAEKNLEFQNQEKGKRAAELILANQDLERAKNDIRKLNEDLEQKVIDRTAQLEIANKELESFSYSVSHDLRAPLRALSGNATILKNDYGDKFDEEGGKFLQSIIRNSKKMGVLIDDLLAFSKLGRKQVAASEINMNSILSAIVDPILLDSENPPGFEIGDLLPAVGDPSLVKQVWINLISNAVKYSRLKPKTVIKIGAYKDGDFVTYFVKDNGAGFDMQYYDKLFGVFQRLHSQEEFEGTGIGLAIVHKIISRHHGKVWAESTLDEGATFYFSLPAINKQAEL